MTIQTNIAQIKKLISVYEQKYGREQGSVRLLASSKTQSIENMSQAIAAGQRIFGENFAQEALTKIDVFADKPIEWHFIGHIQTNKTRKIATHFSWVHTVDNKKIAQRLNDQRPIVLPPLNVCIEVNISHEASKFGLDDSVNEIKALAEYCHSLPNLCLRGLMAIPAPKDSYQEQREEFHKLYVLWQTLRDAGLPLDTLSMGMTHDFEAAIAEGATIIRIGTGIFGERLA